LASEANTSAVRDFLTPKKLKHICGFLGLTGFYRRFIKDYAIIAKQLYQLTKKDQPFHWSPACETAFLALKDALTSPQVLAFPDFSKPFT
jgi:hypothetical protein